MGIYEKKYQYAKDYKTTVVTDKNGRKKKVAEYVGPMIPFRTEAGTVKKKFILVAVLTLILTVCLVVSEMLQHGSAWFVGVSIPLAVALFPCLYLIMGVCALQYNGEAMRRDRYFHSIVRVFKSGAVLLPLAGVSLAADFLYRAVYKDWMYFAGDIIYLVLVLAVILATVGIIVIMRSVEVDERQLL